VKTPTRRFIRLPALVNLRKRIRGGLGHAAEEAISGPQAFDLIQAAPERFDLIISDQTDRDGTVPPDAAVRGGPALHSPRRVQKPDRQGDAENLDIDAFPMKPLDRNALMEAVRRVLDNRARTC